MEKDKLETEYADITKFLENQRLIVVAEAQMFKDRMDEI